MYNLALGVTQKFAKNSWQLALGNEISRSVRTWNIYGCALRAAKSGRGENMEQQASSGGSQLVVCPIALDAERYLTFSPCPLPTAGLLHRPQVEIPP